MVNALTAQPRCGDVENALFYVGERIYYGRWLDNIRTLLLTEFILFLQG
jgi:hypothetical protein